MNIEKVIRERIKMKENFIKFFNIMGFNENQNQVRVERLESMEQSIKKLKEYYKEEK